MMKGLSSFALPLAILYSTSSSTTVLVEAFSVSTSSSSSSSSSVGVGSRIRSRTTAPAITTSTTTTSTSSSQLNYASSEDVFLDGLGIPDGLKQTLLENANQQLFFAKRIWIVDNSGSMAISDGHQVSVDHGQKTECCTRWEELQETVNCHAQLAAVLQAPTEFRLLNPPEKKKNKMNMVHSLFASSSSSSSTLTTPDFRVGYGSRAIRDSKRAQTILHNTKPKGMTPLHTRIQDVRAEVIRMLPELERDGTKVALVIATDGCNYDRQGLTKGSSSSSTEAELNQELVTALESLQGLPVWVVIRLCTDFEPIVDFYNTLDERLDLGLDVLDDHIAEAVEVNRYNKWLNYAIVLHRMREMGQSDPLFDLLDERPFTQEEVRSFCGLLFGESQLPDANTSDWETFIAAVDKIQSKERMHWNPRTKDVSPWIDLSELELMDCIDVDEEQVVVVQQ